MQRVLISARKCLRPEERKMWCPATSGKCLSLMPVLIWYGAGSCSGISLIRSLLIVNLPEFLFLAAMFSSQISTRTLSRQDIHAVLPTSQDGSTKSSTMFIRTTSRSQSKQGFLLRYNGTEQWETMCAASTPMEEDSRHSRETWDSGSLLHFCFAYDRSPLPLLSLSISPGRATNVRFRVCANIPGRSLPAKVNGHRYHLKQALPPLQQAPALCLRLRA